VTSPPGGVDIPVHDSVGIEQFLGLLDGFR